MRRFHNHHIMSGRELWSSGPAAAMDGGLVPCSGISTRAIRSPSKKIKDSEHMSE